MNKKPGISLFTRNAFHWMCKVAPKPFPKRDFKDTVIFFLQQTNTEDRSPEKLKLDVLQQGQIFF